MGHIGSAELEHRREHGVEHGVGHVARLELAKRPAGRRLGHQQGVAGGTADTRGDDPRSADAQMPGHQREVGLVLDLLEPGQLQGGPRVAIDEEPPDLGQPLGAGGVASVHRHVEVGPALTSARVPGHPPHLIVDGSDVGHIHPEIGQRIADLERGGKAHGRTEDQIDACSHAPSQGEADDHVEGKAGPDDHGADSGQRHQVHHQPAPGPVEVGRSDRGHGHRHRHPGDGVALVHIA